MLRSLYEQALCMHGHDLSALVEKNQSDNYIFIENNSQKTPEEKAAENAERDPTGDNPEDAPPVPRKGCVGLTGTMRDLLLPRLSVDSSTEESSKSDTSPEILPLGVPRELHEPFEELSGNTNTISKNNHCGKCSSGAISSRIQDFISRKAHLLFKAPTTTTDRKGLDPIQLPSSQGNEDSVDLDYFATLPPVEQFMEVPPDPARRRLFEILGAGDVVDGVIIAIKKFGMFVRVVCLCGREARLIHNCDVVGLLPKGELGDRFSQKAELEDFRIKDIVRCRVIKTDAANEKVILTMKNESEHNQTYPLGIINECEYPVYFRRSQAQEETQESYDEMLDNTLGFDNPYNVAYLTGLLGIDDADPPSFLTSLQRSNFSEEEYAEALRKWQSNKWSMESVARGVDHFKASRHVEAMQQLNRALEIDAENVEGLVARGALFANQDNLSKAIKDFAEALRIKPNHKNANRYMCQTLVEKGKQCEEAGDKQKAIDCYQSAIDLNPENVEAQLALDKLKKPTRRKSVSDESEEDQKTSSEDASPEQMSAKQLREMIDEDNKKSSKKKKTIEKDQNGKENRKNEKQKKDSKKKKKNKKKLRHSLSTAGKSKDRKKDQSSDSESSSSSAESPPPKDAKINRRKSSKGNAPVRSASPEPRRLAGRKRTRDATPTPPRRSRSKTRKADLIRKRSSRTPSSSSSGSEDLDEKRSKAGSVSRKSLDRDRIERMRRKSKDLTRNNSKDLKRSISKDDKKRTRHDSEASSSSVSSDSMSSPTKGQAKKSKSKEKAKAKKSNEKEEKGSKRRKSKSKKDKVKAKASESKSEESSDSLSVSPIRKKSRNVKSAKKKLKKISKRSKKKADSSSNDSTASDADKKVAVVKKSQKKKKKSKKKKKIERERSPSSSPSVVSLDWPDRKKGQDSVKKPRKKRTRSEPPAGRSSLSSSSEVEAEKKFKEHSPVKSEHSERRSRSASIGKDRKHQAKYEDGGVEVKIGVKRSRSNVNSALIHQEESKAKESQKAEENAVEGRRRQTKEARHSESDKEHDKRKEKHKEKKDSSKEKIVEKIHKKEKEGEKEKEKHDIEEKEKVIVGDVKSQKKHSRSKSPVESKHTTKARRKSEHKKLRKSHESSPSPSPSSSSSSDSPSPARKSSSSKQVKRQEATNEDKQRKSKTSRTSASRSPTGKVDDLVENGKHVRERKRKRSGSPCADKMSPEKSKQDWKSKHDQEGGEGKSHRQKIESRREKESTNTSDSSSSDSSDSVDSIRPNSMKERRSSGKGDSPSPQRSRRKQSPSPGRATDDHQKTSKGKYTERGSRPSRDTNHQDKTQSPKSGSHDRAQDTQKSEGKRREEGKGSLKDGDGKIKDNESRRSQHLSGELGTRKSSERERHRSSEEKRARSTEVEKPKMMDDVKPKSRESDRSRSRDGERSNVKDEERPRSREEARSKSREEERRQSKGEERLKSNEVDRQRSREDDKPKTKEVDRQKSFEKDRPKSRESDKPKVKEDDRRRSRDDKSPKSREFVRSKSKEVDRRKSREGDRERDQNDDSKRRSSHDSHGDKKDIDINSASKDKSHHDSDNRSHERSRECEKSRDRALKDSDKRSERSREHEKERNSRDGRSRDRDEKLKDSDRRRSDGSRESRDRKNRSPGRDARYKEQPVSKKGDKPREGEGKKQTSSNHVSLNLQDIPLPKPPERESKSPAKKEPSPIHYVTSTSCKDEIIKVKSKWDTDSEDDDDVPRSGGRRQGAASRFGAIVGQPSQNQSSYQGSGFGGGGQSYGGYNRNADPVCNGLVSDVLSAPVGAITLSFCSQVDVSNEDYYHHQPLRLRGGCAASPKFDEMHESDSDISYSSSDTIESGEWESDVSVRSASSQSESGPLKSKMLKPSGQSENSVHSSSKSRNSSRSQSSGSSRSSSASSSRSVSSGSANSSGSGSSVDRNSRSRSSSTSSSISSRSSSKSSNGNIKKSKLRRKRESSSSPRSQESGGSGRSSGSRKKPRKKRFKESSGTTSEGSDSGDAEAYMLWDAWEDYLDSKGHDIGKQVATTPIADGGGEIHYGKKREDNETRSNTDTSVNKGVDITSEDDTTLAASKPEIPNSEESQKDEENEEFKNRTDEVLPRSNIQLNAKMSKDSTRKPLKRHHEDSTVKQKQNQLVKTHIEEKKQNLKRHEQPYSSEQPIDADRIGRGSEEPSVRCNQYGSRTVYQSEGVYQGSSDDSRFRGTTSPHHRQTHPSGDSGYRSDRNQPRRHFEEERRHHGNERGQYEHGRQFGDRFNDEERNRYDNRRYHEHKRPHHHRHGDRANQNERFKMRKGQRFWRKDDCDWGRGVTEIKESNTFFGLVPFGKEELILQLYKESSLSMGPLHQGYRVWWL